MESLAMCICVYVAHNNHIDRCKKEDVSLTDTLIMMNVMSTGHVPKSMIIPSSNLKFNEFVGQGVYLSYVRSCVL